MVNSRNKGVGFERVVARKLRAKYPDAKRGLQYQQGEYVPDVVGTPYYIECKSGKRYLSVNIDGKKKVYNPNKIEKLKELYDHYYGRMKLWKDMPVVIIWKLDYKPVYVFDGEKNILLEDFTG